MKSFFALVACLFVCFVGCDKSLVEINDEMVVELIVEKLEVVPHQANEVLKTISPVQEASNPLIASAIGRVAVKRKRDDQILCFLVIPYRPISVGTEVKVFQIHNQRGTGGQAD